MPPFKSARGVRAPLNPGRVRAGKRIEETNGSKEKGR
jgi:hypothetical protein